jgi:hypothetical protein
MSALLPIGSDQPWWVLAFAFLIGHSVADYPLQGEFLALGKNHRNSPEWRHLKPESMRGLWLHCLTAHSLIHAGVVWAISGVFSLGVMEFILHWVIDYIKSAGLTNLHHDQLLHVACKVAYVILLQTSVLGN